MKAIKPAYIAVAVIGVLVGLLVAVTPATAQRVGPYTLVAHSNETSNVGVFRLDQSSGRVSFCYIGASSPVAVTCTPEVD